MYLDLRRKAVQLHGLSVMGYCLISNHLNMNPLPEEQQKVNPFKIGDQVTFAPDDHTVGWSWSSFDRLRLHPGDTGIITRISKEDYLYLDDDRGGFHWECFKKGT